jgi:hypothetical protein
VQVLEQLDQAAGSLEGVARIGAELVRHAPDSRPTLASPAKPPLGAGL